VVGQVGLKRNSRKPESHRLQVPTALTYCDTILCFQSEGSCRELDPSLIFANFLGRSSINSTIAGKDPDIEFCVAQVALSWNRRTTNRAETKELNRLVWATDRNFFPLVAIFAGRLGTA
jgi:hypothetical protein